MAAPWVRFTSEGEALQAFAKQPVEDGGAAVLKVSTLTKAPAWLVRDLFSSENAEVISQWNAFTGDVQHLRDRVQYQAYKMPWPFLTREYLVRCSQSAQVREKSYRIHCIPIKEHADAPPRHDRVRGSSETLWTFVTERGEDGRQQTRISFEGIVDPRGRLPKWIVNEVGRRTSITVVEGLASLADSRWEESSSSGGISKLTLIYVLLFITANALVCTLYLLRGRRLVSFGPVLRLSFWGANDPADLDAAPPVEAAISRKPGPA